MTRQRPEQVDPTKGVEQHRGQWVFQHGDADDGDVEEQRIHQVGDHGQGGRVARHEEGIREQQACQAHGRKPDPTKRLTQAQVVILAGLPAKPVDRGVEDHQDVATEEVGEA
eukprot:732352-Hanusia_phi.AAC.2